ncbi:hypothetical protein C8R46DRAFT_1352926 [Mycena filopes]|nr:hypothetical protein C8R46DRAFT_1352926 [Mycena filopes]
MLAENFAGVVAIEAFFEEYMPPVTDDDDTIREIVDDCVEALTKAKKAAKTSEKENDMATAFVTYLEKIVSDFDSTKQPWILDTHTTIFPPLDKGDHYTKPDIACSRPGLKNVRPEWSDTGTVIELKFRTDIFDATGKINDSDDSRHALVQLAKSARSLLMGLNACYVYVVSVFGSGMARIFRFDHSGFRATNAFEWTTDTGAKIFPTFFYRLYHPKGAPSHKDDPGRMDGHDDTVWTPTQAEKASIYNALKTHPFYSTMFTDQQSATDESLRVQVAHLVDDIPQVVACFTIGSAIWTSDGLFGRGTQVYRAILEKDLKTPNPPVYALKDAWRQRCRRPEIDFYDVINKYCEENNITGMAECHGSLDLSVSPAPPITWDTSLHQTRSTPADNSMLERCHMRSLLTPIGTRLELFPSTKALVGALHTAIQHHETACKAGVLHRDVSDGNVLLQEGPEEPQGFLLDWDYAEFTPQGLENFNAWFPERADENKQYENIDKSLKDMTGTLPFVSIQILKQTVAHAAHHDLESFYWLLIWMILRHTDHKSGPNACGELFDPVGHATKWGWLNDPCPIGPGPLFDLMEHLRAMVFGQNLPTVNFPNMPAPLSLTHEKMYQAFTAQLQLDGWPTDDAAIEFVLPSLDPAKNTKIGGSLRRKTIEKVASSLKRGREEVQEDVVSEGTGPRTRSAAKKRKAEVDT